jgi:hypothetical protein
LKELAGHMELLHQTQQFECNEPNCPCILDSLDLARSHFIEVHGKTEISYQLLETAGTCCFCAAKLDVELSYVAHIAKHMEEITFTAINKP